MQSYLKKFMAVLFAHPIVQVFRSLKTQGIAGWNRPIIE